MTQGSQVSIKASRSSWPISSSIVSSWPSMMRSKARSGSPSAESRSRMTAGSKP